MTRSSVCCLALCIVVGDAATAHDGLDRRLRDVSARLEQEPDDATLYVDRAELHRLHQDWGAAFADLDRATRRGGDVDVISLDRAILLLDVRCPQAALAVLDDFVARRPDHAVAHTRRGHALEAMGRPVAAAAAYERALRHIGTPRPHHYLAWSRALVTAGDIPQGVAALDRGLADLGHLIVLQERAIDLEREMGLLDEALTRLDGVLERAQRREKWLALRSELLLECGQTDAASAASLEALQAIARLPRTRRSTPAVLELEASIRRQVDWVGVLNQGSNDPEGTRDTSP